MTSQAPITTQCCHWCLVQLCCTVRCAASYACLSQRVTVEVMQSSVRAPHTATPNSKLRPASSLVRPGVVPNNNNNNTNAGGEAPPRGLRRWGVLHPGRAQVAPIHRGVVPRVAAVTPCLACAPCVGSRTIWSVLCWPSPAWSWWRTHGYAHYCTTASRLARRSLPSEIVPPTIHDAMHAGGALGPQPTQLPDAVRQGHVGSVL